MKKFFPILAAILAAVSIATAQASQTLILRQGQQKTAVRGIAVRFVAVTEDSRCPSNVDCIWAGVARVKLELKKNGKTGVFELNTNELDKSPVFEGYVFALNKLDPYPAGKPISKGSYTAKLSFAKVKK